MFDWQVRYLDIHLFYVYGDSTTLVYAAREWTQKTATNDNMAGSRDHPRTCNYEITFANNNLICAVAGLRRRRGQFPVCIAHAHTVTLHPARRSASDRTRTFRPPLLFSA